MGGRRRLLSLVAQVFRGPGHARPLYHRRPSSGGYDMRIPRAMLARLGSCTVVLALVSFALVPPATASAQAPVGLGTADGFAVLACSTITNTGPTAITADHGLDPRATLAGSPSQPL